MIRIGICDDEAYMLELISEKIKNYMAANHMDLSLLQYESGLKMLESGEKFDVIFLDIKMKGPDGVETAKRMRAKGFKGHVVFITVSEEDVYRAFKVETFDYLLKPLDEEEFKHTMKRILMSFRNRYEGRMLIRHDGEWSVILFHDIIYAEVINRKIHLRLTDGRDIEYYDQLKRMRERLDGRFCRCHRSYIVNSDHLAGVAHGKELMMDNRDVIPISRTYSETFNKEYFSYIEEWCDD